MVILSHLAFSGRAEDQAQFHGGILRQRQFGRCHGLRRLGQQLYRIRPATVAATTPKFDSAE